MLTQYIRNILKFSNLWWCINRIVNYFCYWFYNYFRFTRWWISLTSLWSSTEKSGTWKRDRRGECARSRSAAQLCPSPSRTSKATNGKGHCSLTSKFVEYSEVIHIGLTKKRNILHPFWPPPPYKVILLKFLHFCFLKCVRMLTINLCPI